MADRKISVLFVHTSHTGGHSSAAEAIKEILDGIPHVRSIVINKLDCAETSIFKRMKISLKDHVIKNWPRLRGWVFRTLMRGNPLFYAFSNWLICFKTWSNARLLRCVRAMKPDIVLSCHSQTNSLFSHWKKYRKLSAPIHSLLTDFRAHQFWAQDHMDCYYVAGELAKRDLEQFGVPASKIQVTGIPVKKKFLRQCCSKASLKRKLGVSSDRFLILVLGGALGSGPFLAMARSFNRLRGHFQVVFITGKNRKKRESLERIKSACSFPLYVLGLVDNPEQWLEASDLVISKPGGVSISEIMAMAKPMVIIRRDSYLEDIQVERLRQMAVPFLSCSLEELKTKVEELMSSPEKLQALAGHSHHSFNPSAALTISGHLLKTVQPNFRL